jgi:hypothetical protein
MSIRKEKEAHHGHLRVYDAFMAAASYERVTRREEKRKTLTRDLLLIKE